MQPEIPVPLVAEFPFPAWATRPVRSGGGEPGRDRRRRRFPTTPTPASPARRLRRGRRVRILHTSDWHVGKTLRGASRLDEHRAVLAEIAGSHADEQVDLVLVTGDLFETAAPPPEAQRVVLGRAARAARHRRARRRDRRQPRQPARARRGRARVRRAPASPCSGTRPVPSSAASWSSRPRAASRSCSCCCRSSPSATRSAPSRCSSSDAAEAAGLYAERMRRLIDALSDRLRARHGQPRRRALLRARRQARRRRARRADDLRLRHRARALPGQRQLRRARPPPPHAAHGRARARPGTRARRSRSTSARKPTTKHVLLVDAAARRAGQGHAAALATHRGRCAPCAARSPSCGSAPSDVGDAWLRVFVREPTRAGLADDVRALLPRAVDVRVERPDDGDAPDVREERDAPARAARRTSCSPSTSRARASRIRVSSGSSTSCTTTPRSRRARDASGRAARRRASACSAKPVDIDFDGVDYFALVGPTGAGKSTVIDAICFALYGSVPRYGDERQVARVVSVGKLESQGVVDVRDRHRALPRHPSGARPQREGEHARGDPRTPRSGRSTTAACSRAARSQLKPAVEQLLGLPFAHFTKCVVLPQGEFARFLHDEPAKRRDLLTRLLDLEIYDKVGQLARQRAAAAKHAVDDPQQTRDALAGATDAARQGRADATRRIPRAAQDARRRSTRRRSARRHDRDGRSGGATRDRPRGATRGRHGPRGRRPTHPDARGGCDCRPCRGRSIDGVVRALAEQEEQLDVASRSESPRTRPGYVRRARVARRNVHHRDRARRGGGKRCDPSGRDRRGRRHAPRRGASRARRLTRRSRRARVTRPSRRR